MVARGVTHGTPRLEPENHRVIIIIPSLTIISHVMTSITARGTYAHSFTTVVRMYIRSARRLAAGLRT